MMGPELSAIANHIWQSTLCAAAVWILTLALKKQRAAIRYRLWIVASVKFLIPFALLVEAGHRVGPPPEAPSPPVHYPGAIGRIGEPFLPGAPAIRPNAETTAALSPATLLAALWLCGFGVSAFFWMKWWRAMQRVRRTAAPLDWKLDLPVLASGERLEPGVFGIWRPVMLLPEGIADRLTPDQLASVVAHELCHFRRRDNLTAAVHMLVESIFWFHPLVWWIRARLLEERERACDEDVLNQVGDARIYAEAMLNVCKFYVELPGACAAGVTGSNLAKRIEAIMAHRRALRLSAGMKLLLVSAALMAVAGPLVTGMLDPAPLRAQSQEGLSFAVASIRPDKSDPNAPGHSHGMQFLPGGRFVVRSLPLHLVIATAYDVPFQSDRLTGGPAWIHDDAYDIEARAAEGAIPPGAPAKERDEKMRLMLQSLLADRFHLKIRREVRDLAVYAVVVRKSGPKLKRASIQEKDCSSATGLGLSESCHSFQGGQGRGLHAQAVSIADIALAVSNWADRPVIDKTGIDGLFSIETDGWLPMRPRPPRPAGQEPSAEDRAFADPGIPTLFQIFERLGLKVESQRAPVEAYVIESIERPSEN